MRLVFVVTVVLVAGAAALWMAVHESATEPPPLTGGGDESNGGRGATLRGPPNVRHVTPGGTDGTPDVEPGVAPLAVRIRVEDPAGRAIEGAQCAAESLGWTAITDGQGHAVLELDTREAIERMRFDATATGFWPEAVFVQPEAFANGPVTIPIVLRPQARVRIRDSSLREIPRWELVLRDGRLIEATAESQPALSAVLQEGTAIRAAGCLPLGLSNLSVPIRAELMVSSQRDQTSTFPATVDLYLLRAEDLPCVQVRVAATPGAMVFVQVHSAEGTRSLERDVASLTASLPPAWREFYGYGTSGAWSSPFHDSVLLTKDLNASSRVDLAFPAERSAYVVGLGQFKVSVWVEDRRRSDLSVTLPDDKGRVFTLRPEAEPWIDKRVEVSVPESLAAGLEILLTSQRPFVRHWPRLSPGVHLVRLPPAEPSYVLTAQCPELGLVTLAFDAKDAGTDEVLELQRREVRIRFLDPLTAKPIPVIDPWLHGPGRWLEDCRCYVFRGVETARGARIHGFRRLPSGKRGPRFEIQLDLGARLAEAVDGVLEINLPDP